MRHFHEKREEFYLIAVLSQLRALASFDPKSKSRSLNPLLIDLARESDFELELYSIPPKPKKGPPGMAGAILTSKTWSSRQVPGFEQYKLRDWLLARAYHSDTSNTYFNRNDLIRQLSEKSAVHYDKDVGELVDTMRRSFGSNYNGVQFFIVDTAAAVFYCGAKYLRTRDLEQRGENASTDVGLQKLDDEFFNLQISML